MTKEQAADAQAEKMSKEYKFEEGIDYHDAMQSNYFSFLEGAEYASQLLKEGGAGVWIKCSFRLPIGEAPAVSRGGTLGVMTVHKDFAMFKYSFSNENLKYEFSDSQLYEYSWWESTPPPNTSLLDILKGLINECKIDGRGNDWIGKAMEAISSASGERNKKSPQ